MRKCLKIFREHKPKKISRTVLRDTNKDHFDSFFYPRRVAETWKQESEICKRCRKSLTEWKNTEFLSDIQSVSMPASLTREWEKQGWVLWE